jgi:hypothetical protein
MNPGDPAYFDRPPNRPDGLPSFLGNYACDALMKPALEVRCELYAGIDRCGIRNQKSLKHFIRKQPTAAGQANDFVRPIE